jgi:hypothetical protein
LSPLLENPLLETSHWEGSLKGFRPKVIQKSVLNEKSRIKWF